MADPVPEPESPKRPVLSPDPEQLWRPEPRRRARPPERHRPFWRLESSQYVLLLMAIVVVIMLVMFGVLVSSFLHAAHSTHG